MSDDQEPPVEDPWDRRLNLLEKRFKHVLAALASIVVTLIATALTIIAGWHQIQAAISSTDATLTVVEAQADHATATANSNEQRLDQIGAPAPGGTP